MAHDSWVMTLSNANQMWDYWIHAVLDMSIHSNALKIAFLLFYSSKHTKIPHSNVAKLKIFYQLTTVVQWTISSSSLV